jgi:putative copper export protein
MLDVLPLWLHIVAAGVWLGSQAMMFVAVVPALREVPLTERLSALERLAARLAWLGWAALLLLVATGIDNIRQYAPADIFEIRYGYILVAKLAMLGVVLLTTAGHTFAVGPALLDAQRRAAAGDGGAEASLPALRAASAALSSLNLLLTLAILFCAALLRAVFAQRLA